MTFDEYWVSEMKAVGATNYKRESVFYALAKRAWDAATNSECVAELKTDAEELARLRTENGELRRLLARYRDETPLGNQPHMIAHQVDDALGRGTNTQVKPR